MHDEADAARPPTSFAALVRHVAVCGVAGVVTGAIVGGLGSRVFMRIAGATGRAAAQGATTEAGFTVGEVTIGGTIGLIVFVGLVFGIVGAVLFAVFRPWLGWAGRLRGVVFGVVLFAIGSATSDVLNPDNFDFAVLARPLLDVLVIAGLFVVFGVVLEEAYRFFDRRLVSPEGTEPVGGQLAFAALGAVVGVPLTVGLMFGDPCDCDPPLLVAVFTLLTAVGTVLWWSRRARLGIAARVAGYLGLLGATGIGLVRAIGDAAEIIG
jgi:hypothetical protein